MTTMEISLQSAHKMKPFTLFFFENLSADKDKCRTKSSETVGLAEKWSNC